MSSVTVVVPMTIRRRGGRKQIFGPDGAAVQPAVGAPAATAIAGDPALVKALARAFRWRRMLEEGRHGSIRELAKAEGVDRSYAGRLLNLTLLAPDVVEAVLDGRQPDGLTAAVLGGAMPVRWDDQRMICGTAAPQGPGGSRKGLAPVRPL
jgi:hypothetical protein